MCRVVGIQCLSKGEKRFRRGSVRDARRKSLFDWPVAFTKVILMVANCTLAKRERKNKTKQNYIYSLRGESSELRSRVKVEVTVMVSPSL